MKVGTGGKNSGLTTPSGRPARPPRDTMQLPNDVDATLKLLARGQYIADRSLAGMGNA